MPGTWQHWLYLLLDLHDAEECSESRLYGYHQVGSDGMMDNQFLSVFPKVKDCIVNDLFCQSTVIQELIGETTQHRIMLVVNCSEGLHITIPDIIHQVF